MDFAVDTTTLNSLLQVGMASFMWRYNRINRPWFGPGTLISLRRACSMFAGITMWWEGRKLEKIEGNKDNSHINQSLSKRFVSVSAYRVRKPASVRPSRVYV